DFGGRGKGASGDIGVTNAPRMIRLFRDSKFIFNCDFRFSGRYAGEENYFSGNGKLYNRRIWESNFIANAPDMLLYGWKERGAGGFIEVLDEGGKHAKK